MRHCLPLISLTAALLVGPGFLPPAQADTSGIHQVRYRVPGQARAERRAAQREGTSERDRDGAESDGSAEHNVFKVGAGEKYQKPSDVEKLVRSGDTIDIAPGTYSDCLMLQKRLKGVTITGQGATLTGESCGGKGLLVILGSDITVRGLTFQGAKVKDHNGAGIRFQGANLTVENSRFIGNENGILVSAKQGSTVIVRDSFFQGNGECIGQCSHAIYVNQVDLVRIERSEFVDTHRGHHIKSRARRTEIVDNNIHDGPGGNSSFLIDLPNGGDAVITGNKFEKGPKAENRGTAISIGEEAKKPQNPASEIRIENNSFTSDLAEQTIFVRNRSNTAAVLRGNKIAGKVKTLEGPGSGS